MAAVLLSAVVCEGVVAADDDDDESCLSCLKIFLSLSIVLGRLAIKLSSPNHEKCRDGYRGIFYCGSVNWHFAISNRIRSLNIELLDTHVVQSKRINIGS